MNDDIGAQHPLPSDPGSFSEVPAGQHLTLGRMAEILRASGCVVYASSQPPIQKADIERLPPTEAEIEDARQEGYNEGYEEGKSEWRGVKAQLWNAMQHWLTLRHGLVDTTGEGYTVNDILDGLAEVEAENKRLLLAARRVRPSPVDEDAGDGVLEDHRKAVGCGMVLAAGICASRGDDTDAEEILRAAGLETEAEIRATGIEDYDIGLLRGVLDHMSLQSQRKG